MKEKNSIPEIMLRRLKHFEGEVKDKFTFLSDYGYTLYTIEKGQDKHLLDYYCNLIFRNKGTEITISYNTDILNGNIKAYPQVKKRPVIDNLVTCSITDSNALMFINEFAKTIFPEWPSEKFSISLESNNILKEVSWVVNNYGAFFKNHLEEVLTQSKIYDCYTDRFYDSVFKEIKYH